VFRCETPLSFVRRGAGLGLSPGETRSDFRRLLISILHLRGHDILQVVPRFWKQRELILSPGSTDFMFSDFLYLRTISGTRSSFTGGARRTDKFTDWIYIQNVGFKEQLSYSEERFHFRVSIHSFKWMIHRLDHFA